jgi:hypothetical protein
LTRVDVVCARAGGDGQRRVDDEPRYLAPKLGYTHNPHVAIDQLECVTASEQRVLADRARQRERERLRGVWEARSTTIVVMLDEVLQHRALPRPVARRVGSLVRQMRSIDQLMRI